MKVLIVSVNNALVLVKSGQGGCIRSANLHIFYKNIAKSLSAMVSSFIMFKIKKKEVIEMELKDTIELMNSNDYKERFKAEYLQTKIRYDKLHKLIIKMEAGTCDFTPSCSLEVHKEQAKYMGMYLHMLEVRAEIEKIDLN